MAVSKDELKNLLAIDRNKLDLECEGQADLYFNHALELAEAKNRLREAENKLEMHKADLVYKIKQDPLMYNLETATDKSTDSVVKSDKTYQALQRMVQAIENEVDIRNAFITALDHRKRMLQELVALHGQNYFAKVEIPNETAQKMQAKAKSQARIPMNRPTKQPTTRPTEPVTEEAAEALFYRLFFDPARYDRTLETYGRLAEASRE